MTPVTGPAPRPSLPPRITHSGTTDTSSAKPANHSIAEPSSQGMPGARQTEPDAGTPSTPIRPVFHALPRPSCPARLRGSAGAQGDQGGRGGVLDRVVFERAAHAVERL